MRRRVCPITAVLLAVGLLKASLPADEFDPPAGYYSSATGTGTALKSQLNSIIDGHIIRSYGDARTLLQITDEDPNDPDRMILAYDRVSLDVSAINPNGSIPGWDNAATWNREHTWPRSRGVDDFGPDNSDLHQLRPTFTQTNSNRDNLNFGGSFGQPFGPVAGGYWYPGDADAGMIARQQFYMAVRYDGADSGTTDLELVNGNPGIGGTTMGDLARLIEWHFAAPPDDFERGRNHKVYGLQNNRNPFVDHPEYVWSIFVDQANDSQITLASGADGGGGATSLDVDLGRVLVGSAAPGSQSVALNKGGLDGTYYNVTTTGDATSSLGGPRNAFRTGATDTALLSVGLNVSTETAGLRTGTVTIDNLDITTAGGAGRGASDGDDVINLSLTVLEHATPSFSPTEELTTLTLNFGQVTQGDDPLVLDFGLSNLATSASFTAGLDLTQILSSGDTDRLATSLAPFTPEELIAGGESRLETASLLTDEVGEFMATYMLALSDENLPGALPYMLTLNLLGEVVAAGLPGDFNSDGSVDSIDYAVWREGLGTSYESEDFDDWLANYGATASGTLATSAPEPAALFLFASVAMGMLVRRGPKPGGTG